MSKSIKLIELMNSWQGEGPDSGRQMLIARFKYCNRHCYYCDTQVKMNCSTEGTYSIDDINESLEKTRGLMITGGEPTFESDKNDNFKQTLLMLNECEYEIANVETNGYKLLELLVQAPDNKNIRYMFSPKVFNGEDCDVATEIFTKTINYPNVFYKIVVDRNEHSTRFIKYISNKLSSRSRIYLMVLGSSKEEITKNFVRCIDLADECNCNMSVRLHILCDFI